MQQDKAKNKIIVWLNRLEDNIVILLLTSILIFAVTQVLLRNLFDSGIVWGENLLRILVLWLGLAGAIVASRQGKQIRIDVLSQFLSDKNKLHIKRLSLLFTATVCLIVSFYSFEFTLLEYEAGSYAFEKVPSWLTIIIIPISFAIMSVKYLIKMFVFDLSGREK